MCTPTQRSQRGRFVNTDNVLKSKITFAWTTRQQKDSITLSRTDLELVGSGARWKTRLSPVKANADTAKEKRTDDCRGAMVIITICTKIARRPE